MSINSPDPLTEKAYLFHKELRAKQIEQYKSKVRKQMSISNLTDLMNNLPGSQAEVLKWCQEVLNEYSLAADFLFPEIRIAELFRLLQTYPCPATFNIFHAVSRNISIAGIHILFQNDIIGLLQKIIVSPHKIFCNLGDWRQSKGELTEQKHIEFIIKSFRIVRNVCQVSEKARNFIIFKPKFLLTLESIYKKYGQIIKTSYYEFLGSCTKFAPHNNEYNIQLYRIVNSIMDFLNEDLTPSQLSCLLVALTNVVKWKSKWALDLIENINNNLLDRVKEILSYCLTHWDPRGNKIVSSHEEKDKGELSHNVNIFLIFYTEISTNFYFDWKGFLDLWLMILQQQGAAFSNSRRDAYFILNNILFEGNSSQSGFSMIKTLIFDYRCLRCFNEGLEKEANSNVFEELSYCVQSILRMKTSSQIRDEVLSSRIVSKALEVSVSGRFEINDNSRQSLLMGVVELLDNSDSFETRNRILEEVGCFEEQLSSYCSRFACVKAEAIDVILKYLGESRMSF